MDGAEGGRRFTPGGYSYHVCNRGSRRGVVLETYEDYAAFCALVGDARRKNPMRMVAYSFRETHFTGAAPRGGGGTAGQPS